MDSDSETEELVAMTRTYDKMKRRVHKIGFVEGLTSGKEAEFQDGFVRVSQESNLIEKNIHVAVNSIQMESNFKQGLSLVCSPQNIESSLHSSSVREDNDCGP